MWHEARRQEKQLRARIIDGSKRAERRRKFYDSIRRDPDQFMQVHGSKRVIHTERSIARAAEDANILRPWQGDKSVLIDRFDVRSHLDCIEPVEEKPKLTSMEEKEELICNFERYRLLIMNEFKDISEKAVLKNISEKEFWLTGQTEDQRKQELEKRRKTMDSKASIGFTYGDSETVAGRNEPESSSEEEMQAEDIDADLERYLYGVDSQLRCNKIGESYGVRDSHFCALFKADQQAQRTSAEIRRIDRQKASLVGREAKDNRRLLKKERAILIANAKQDDALVTLSSFAKKEKERNPLLEEAMASSSSEEEPTKAEFILSFGDDVADKNKKRSKKKKNQRNGRERYRSRSRDRKRSRSRSWNRRSSSPDDRRRKRSQSRSRRSRSRSRSKDRRRSRDRRSRDRSRDRKRSRRSRSRSHDKRRRYRSSSSSSRSRSRDRTPDAPMFKSTKTVETPVFQEPIDTLSSDDDGPTNLLEIRSSMSESEKERIEIENRKRRIRRTKKMVKSKTSEKAKSRRQQDQEREKMEQALAMKKKLKKALTATVEELKEEEEGKKREAERERKARDEAIQLDQLERKAREQRKMDELRKVELDKAIESAKQRAEAQIREIIKQKQEDAGTLNSGQNQ